MRHDLERHCFVFAIKRTLFPLLSLVALAGCSLNGSIWGSSKADSNSGTLPSFKLSELPTSVPESYPYYGQVDVTDAPSDMILSLQDSTCKGLEITPQGLVTGVLDLKNGKTCEYKIKMSYGSEDLTSDLLTLSVGTSLVLSLSKTNVDLRKGDTSRTVSLNLSAAAPFTTYLSYDLYSSNGTYGVVSGINSTGLILVPKGATSVDISLQVPSSAALTSVGYDFLQLNNGMSGLKPSLSSTLYEPADIPVFEQVTAGTGHSCGISSGKLYCWGKNDYGQIGNGETSSSAVSPVRIGSSTTWQKVAAGFVHTCGIDDGKLFCWGRDNFGQVGNGPGSSANVTSPVQIGALTDWQALAAGTYFTCGIQSGGLYCWGYDQFGQIGNGPGSSANVTAPERIGGSATWQDVGAGTSHACGIDAGKLFCWGQDSRGQVGNGSASSANVVTPVQIGVSTTWQSVEPGSGFSCGIDAGKLFCWGDDSYGQLGNGDILTDFVHAPEQVGTANTWQSISAAGNHACGIAAGALFCWGATDYSTQISSPTQVGTSLYWSSVAVGDTHACGINTGHINCWGTDANNDGYIIPETIKTSIESPAVIGNSTSWKSLSMGVAHSCGIDNGKLYCWGLNSNMQTGNGDSNGQNVLLPQQIGNSATWESVSLGDTHTCGIDDGKLYCWGFNDEGQIGKGSPSFTSEASPLRVGTSSSWQAVAAGGYHTCGIESGKLYCWGLDYFGQLGNGAGSADSVGSPQQIGTSTTWQSVAAGLLHTCGINAGKLYCWGKGGEGQIGDGSSTDITEPLQIGTSSTWQMVVGGGSHTCGLDAGKLYCWGDDSNGQLGNGAASFATVVTPEQIGSSSAWQTIASGTSSLTTCGLNSGKLYCWGSDSNGHLGNGSASAVDVEEPEQIGTSNTWQTISVGAEHSCGIDNGKLSCWGGNESGQVAVSEKRFFDLSVPTMILNFTN